MAACLSIAEEDKLILVTTIKVLIINLIIMFNIIFKYLIHFIYIGGL